MDKAGTDGTRSPQNQAGTTAAGGREVDIAELLQSAPTRGLQTLMPADEPAIKEAADRYRQFINPDLSTNAKERAQRKRDRATYADLYPTAPDKGQEAPLREAQRQITFMTTVSRVPRGSIVTWLYQNEVRNAVDEFSRGAITKDQAGDRIRAEYVTARTQMRKLGIAPRLGDDAPKNTPSAQDAATITKDRGSGLGM